MKENSLPKSKIMGDCLVRKVIRGVHYWRAGKGWNILESELISCAKQGVKYFKVIEESGTVHSISLSRIKDVGKYHKNALQPQYCIEEKYFDTKDVKQLEMFNESQAPKSMAHLDPKKQPPVLCMFIAMWGWQNKLANSLPKWLSGNKYQQTLQLTRPLIHEVIELEQNMEKYWKGWKTSAYAPDDHEIKMEIVDCMHFLLQISQQHFNSPHEFHEFYICKNEENFKRIERKY